MNKPVQLKWYSYTDLDKDLLYAILKFRQEVFIVEQQSPYLDVDGQDQDSHHLVGTKDNEIVAYARIRPHLKATIPYLKFGRLILHKEFRGTGLGLEVLNALFDFSDKEYKGLPQRADAQCALIDYYAQYGFKASGEPFDDGGIMHRLIERVPAS